ncbi:c-type heme family protein [Gimesia sp.]|uniref:c-type heme family protein n=1 Tax=Gimesia sp. TaxID=2024833 RepID=UPI003A90C907
MDKNIHNAPPPFGELPTMFSLAPAFRSLCVLLSVAVLLSVVCLAEEQNKDADQLCEQKVKGEPGGKQDLKKANVDAAREQARLLHEALHSTLLIVHQKYYREDEKLPIPSSVLDEVFEHLQETRDIKFRWISVNAEAMNIDHEPQTEFEKQAAKAIADGKTEYEQVEKGVYRHAGMICLPSQCLKCHMPNRRSTATRFAGLVISLPVKEK